MKREKRRKVDPVPNEFASYEEAAEFWNTHDTTDYLENFEDASITGELRKRTFELEVDEKIHQALKKKAKKMGISVTRLANQILQEQISRVA